VTDELAIRDLLARVAQTCDFGTLDDYLGLFTEDATLDMPDNPQVGVLASRREGRPALAVGVRERRALGVQGPGTATIHVVTTVTVERTGADTASASSYWMYYARCDGTPELRSIGHYADDVRRTDDGWRIARRRITVGPPTS
jgi:3-phenylpropionate/cinnamic acid dioxygenase small subunit